MAVGAIATWTTACATTNLPSYYAHPTAVDGYGVIAPWYRGLNGQLDERLSIAVNVYKRYPWVDQPKAVMAAPDWPSAGAWAIASAMWNRAPMVPCGCWKTPIPAP